MPAQTPRSGTGAAAEQPRRQRSFTAAYKLRILERYDELDRAGKTALLRAERLRASQVSDWRAVARKGALQALAGEAGGQPRREIPFSARMWAALTAAGAAADPPMSPERYLRALCAYELGWEKRPPGGPGAPAPGDRAVLQAGPSSSCRTGG